MLDNHTLDKLPQLKLTGMADAFLQQLEQPEAHALSFTERFALLVDRETTRAREPPPHAPAATGTPTAERMH